MFSNRWNTHNADIQFSFPLYMGQHSVGSVCAELVHERQGIPIVIISGDPHYQQDFLRRFRFDCPTDFYAIDLRDIVEHKIPDEMKDCGCVFVCGDQQAIDLVMHENVCSQLSDTLVYIPNGLHIADVRMWSSIIIDPAYCRYTTRADVGAIACSALFQLITSYANNDSIVMDCWVATGLSLLTEAFGHIVATPKKALCDSTHTAGVMCSGFIGSQCAVNRGENPIVGLSRACTVPSWSNLHMSRAAMLPSLLTLLKRQNRHRYSELTVMIGSDPIEYIQSWITIAGFKEFSMIFDALSTQAYKLLRDEHTFRYLQSYFDAITSIYEKSGDYLHE